ncbi:MAG: glycosyltransferase family 39 protein [Gammaproteobacteria bacterium]|nr:glycosyltransferase family 39 protein [Gammaproteobacteria bacterium]
MIKQKLRVIQENQQVLSKNNSNASPLISKNTYVDLVYLILFIGLFYAIWIGSHALFTPDEGRYSEVAREMVASGDYVTPRLNGVAFLDKPALYYWLQAAAIKLFGLKEWSLRFWPAFMGVLGAVVTYFTASVLFNRRTGILSALILATAPLYYGGAHYANLDLEVASLIGNSLLCFIAGMQATSTQWRNRFLFAAYIFSGLAALTKGLIGIVFPAMIVGAWILLLNRWALLKRMHVIAGAVIFLMITAPWYFLVQKANPEFLHFFFVTQQVSRFLTTQDFNSKAAIWFYVPVVLAGFFPWSVFLIQAIYKKIKLVLKDRQQFATELFLLLWFAIVLVFFSIPLSKTVGYILPIFPVSAVLVGSYLSDLWNAPQAKGISKGLVAFEIVIIAVAAFFLVSPRLSVQLEMPMAFTPYLQAMGLVLLATAALMLFLPRRVSLLPLFSSFLAMIVALLLIFLSSAGAINDKSIKPLATALKPTLNANDEVVTFFRYYQDLPIYLERRITIVADWQAEDIPHNDNWVREMWYGMVFQDTKDWLIGENSFWQRWNSPKHLYVITDARYLDAFKKHKYYVVGKQNEVFLLSNKPSDS